MLLSSFNDFDLPVKLCQLCRDLFEFVGKVGRGAWGHLRFAFGFACAARAVARPKSGLSAPLAACFGSKKLCASDFACGFDCAARIQSGAFLPRAFQGSTSFIAIFKPFLNLPSQHAQAFEQSFTKDRVVLAGEHSPQQHLQFDVGGHSSVNV